VKSFAFDNWDGGRLTVNREFSPILGHNGLTTFDALMEYSAGQFAKNVLRERTTTRLELNSGSGDPKVFFLKRHSRPPLVEFVKPWLRLQRPILGARNEWEAILRFHEAGIATMIPVTLGQSRGQSFLLTAAIEGCRKLSEWMNEQTGTLCNGQRQTWQYAITGVADVARTMHAAGLHHQDFYLTHLMLPFSKKGEQRDKIHVLDLGRVRWHRRLSSRWIIKDLAQLDYSATRASKSDRLRFLTTYFGRRPQIGDRRLIRRIQRKSRAIARHSLKNSL
jgi:lipopolysaccharide core heptose(I) kinase